MSYFTGYGAAAGCFIDDCINTDKFAVSTLENCISVCNTIPECNYWVFGEEEGMQKCWYIFQHVALLGSCVGSDLFPFALVNVSSLRLRVADDGREAGEGWTSGHKSCQPPGTMNNSHATSMGAL